MLSPGKRVPALSLLLALGVCINLVELLIPSPPFLPWLKPGLANAFTLSAIYLAGPVYGIALAVLRSLIAAVLSGLPATSLLIGGSGGIVSAAGMGLLVLFTRRFSLFSPLGVGIFGAFLHTLTQLCVVYLLFIKNTYIFWQVPFLGPVAIATGVITSLLAVSVMNFILDHEDLIVSIPPTVPALTWLPVIKLLFLAVLSVSIFLITRIPVHLVILGAGLVLVWRRGFKILLRFIPLILITFVLNALATPGHYIASVPWVTVEGMEKGLLLCLRLLNLIALSLFLFRQEDLSALLGAIGRAFPALSDVTEIGIRGIALIPRVVAVLKDFYVKSPEKGAARRIIHLTNGLSAAMLEILNSPLGHKRGPAPLSSKERGADGGPIM